MSYNGHPVIDADSHLREYDDFDRTHKEFIDPAYREQFERLSLTLKAWQRSPEESALGDFLWPRRRPHPLGVYDDYARPRSGTYDVTRDGAQIDHETNHDPSIRLRDMDIAGVDISVMFASQSDGFCVLDDVGFETALTWAYNRSMSQYCADSEGRLWWLANSSMRNIDDAVAQLKYWAEKDPHFAGMFVPRALPDGAMLDNPRLYPIFALSQDLDLPIWIHGGANRPPLTPWVDAPNSLYHGLGGMYAMHALVGGGVFDVFPTLRIGLFESAGGWMPWMIEKLDMAYQPGSRMAPKLKRKPSEVVAEGRLYCSIETEEEYLEHIVDTLGEDIWLFSTDYPHHGSPWPDGVPQVAKRDELSESAKIKMFGENALRFLPRLRSGLAAVGLSES